MPIVFWVSGCFWAVWRLTSGRDDIGGKTAARILTVPILIIVAFFGLAGLPAYGLLGYVLMLWVTMLLAPFVVLVYFAPGAVNWTERHVLFRRAANN